MPKQRSKYHLKRKKKNVLTRRFERLKLMLLWLVIGTLAIPVIATGYINLATNSDRYSELTKVPHEIWKLPD
jgi:vancomycin permeability regulator SanA